MKHKWYNEIVAWAGGAEIEARNRKEYNNPNAEFTHWWTIQDPHWETHNDTEYRIKPQPVELPCLDVSVFNNEVRINADRLFLAGVNGKFKIRLENDDGA